MLSTSTLHAQLKFFAPANQSPPARPMATAGALQPMVAAERQPVPAGQLMAASQPMAAGQPTPAGPPTVAAGEMESGVVTTNAQVDVPESIAPSAVDEALTTGGDLPPAPPAESVAVPAETALPSEPIPMSDGITVGPGFEQPIDGMLIEGDQPLLYSTNSWFRRGYWYSQADITFLLRTNITTTIFAADQSFKTTGTDGQPVDIGLETRPMLASQSVAPTYEPGVRLTLGRMLGQDNVNRDHSVEFGFLGLTEYSERATLSAVEARGLETALAPGAEYRFGTGVVNSSFTGFSETSVQTLQYDSDFNSGEMNFRIAGRPMRDRLMLQPNGNWVRHGATSQLKTFLFGARYVGINDRMLYTAFEDPDRNTLSGELEVETSNHMFGMQIGGELMENYTNWSWGIRFKAAGMYNFADRNSRLLQTAEDLGTRTEALDRNNLAPLLDGGIVASYQLRPNISLRASYDMMYITGIANAIENARLGDTFPKFEVTGDAFYHGLSVGLETLW